MEKADLKSLLEALLFTASEPITLDHFASVISDEEQDVLAEALNELRTDFSARNAGVVLRELAGGYQLFSDPRWHSQIQALFSKPLMVRLSRSALETLAIVAYKQPITLPEISEIRSCNAAGAIKTLLECNFIKVLGRKRVIGRPFLYGTTREFLLHFGLKELSEMPQLQEFEELIGEKLSTESFQPTGVTEEMEIDSGEESVVPPPEDSAIESDQPDQV
jgi:segregation and condensation protein B